MSLHTDSLEHDLLYDARQVGVSPYHESAVLHLNGKAIYTDDIPESQGTLHIALGLSSQAHANILSMDLQPVKAAKGVVAVLTVADVPGENNCGPVLHDDPLFADGVVHYVGQPIFAVIATSHDLARRAARLANIEYETLPAILTAKEAKAVGASVLPPFNLVRGNPHEKLASAPHRLQGTFECGGQEQFYLEGQISYALPQDDGAVRIYCSTQHPTEMQMLAARALNVSTHKIEVTCRRMGGGFGGKESQSALYACVAAIAAQKLHRPIKLRLDREDDMTITGKRHGVYYEWDIGFDSEGHILGAHVDMALNAGYSADLSGPVATRAVCHFDNAYYLEHVAIHALCARTNTQSNTAFRGFGGPQGALVMEVILDNIGRHLGIDPLLIRQRNFYGHEDRNLTPYGQVVKDNVIDTLVAQLSEDCRYHERRQAVLEFNKHNTILKKGLALTPVKFGISFNFPAFNQAGALVHVYRDGSVLVNHGGTEMGQGLNTKVAQVVAHELGLTLDQVRCTATDTSKVANTSATAASTGSDLNGMAAQDAAAQVRARLTEFWATLQQLQPEDIHFAKGMVYAGSLVTPFAEVVEQAYLQRVQLWSDGFYATPGLHWDGIKMTGNPFYYFSYGAAVAEVVLDTLTGEWSLLAADALHDVGRSLNPALDIGQVEGAFIQGMGWLTLEELWWDKEGRLRTHAPSTYKIPAIRDCPEHFSVKLFDNQNVQPSIHRSKAVGEPPLLLPFCVFNALRDAVASTSNYTRQPTLNAPATPEAILAAVERAQHGS
ncbi:xanthine dehydrogenase molybdopterin binding subunit [Paenalcaligenes sp. Me52]|uniref:xanthine dehydrogenase molybdopterin binding subunit n=1 Tax=Paenalcaligenes sp. Me52 TaxID=3392038 RepID=UPI003D2768B2